MEEKRKILGQLLATYSTVRVLIKDPSTCILPPHLRDSGEILLEIGYDMAIPIPDLDLGTAAWSGTLSFKGKSMWVCVPWSCVVAYILPDGRGIQVGTRQAPDKSKKAKVVSLCEYRKRKGLHKPSA